MIKEKKHTIKMNGNEITADMKFLSDIVVNRGVKMNLKSMFEKPNKYKFEEVFDHRIIKKIGLEAVEEETISGDKYGFGEDLFLNSMDSENYLDDFYHSVRLLP